MSIATEITKLISNLNASYTACDSKSAAMPPIRNFDNLPDTISSISGGYTCYTGAGIPSNSLGNNGDIYINVG